MSYRVLTEARLPYVHSVGGLGANDLVATSSSDPWGVRIAEAFGTPIIGALSQRIAYGKPPEYAYPTGNSSLYYQPGGASTPYFGYGTGGFDPRTLMLIGGAGLLAMMLLRR